MPIYTYKCQDCGEEFDLLVGVGRGDEKLLCPKCGGKKLGRLLSSFGLGDGSGTGSSCTTPT